VPLSVRSWRALGTPPGRAPTSSRGRSWLSFRPSPRFLYSSVLSRGRRTPHARRRGPPGTFWRPSCRRHRPRSTPKSPFTGSSFDAFAPRPQAASGGRCFVTAPYCSSIGDPHRRTAPAWRAMPLPGRLMKWVGCAQIWAPGRHRHRGLEFGHLCAPTPHKK